MTEEQIENLTKVDNRQFSVELGKDAAKNCIKNGNLDAFLAIGRYHLSQIFGAEWTEGFFEIVNKWKEITNV